MSIRAASSGVVVRPRLQRPCAVPVNVLMDLAERTGTVDAPVEVAVVA